jgi:hypothetical protein
MTDAHERALEKAYELQFPRPHLDGGIEAYCQTYLTALLDDPAMVEAAAERMVLNTGYSSDSPCYDVCLKGAKQDIIAAIAAIKEAAGV